MSSLRVTESDQVSGRTQEIMGAIREKGGKGEVLKGMIMV
jgi:hypothetical protein